MSRAACEWHTRWPSRTAAGRGRLTGEGSFLRVSDLGAASVRLRFGMMTTERGAAFGGVADECFLGTQMAAETDSCEQQKCSKMATPLQDPIHGYDLKYNRGQNRIQNPSFVLRGLRRVISLES